MMFRTKNKYRRCYAGMAQIGWNSISSYWDPNKPFTKVLSEHTNPRITRSELAMSILQHPQPCKQAKDPATSSRRAPFSFPRPCSTKHSIIHQHCSSTLYSGRIFLATEVRTLLEKKPHLRPQQRSHSLGGHSWPQMSKDPWHAQNRGFQDLNMHNFWPLSLNQLPRSRI